MENQEGCGLKRANQAMGLELQEGVTEPARVGSLENGELGSPPLYHSTLALIL